MPKEITDDRDRGATLSVVIASNRDGRLLTACIESIRPAAARRGAELIVARAGDADEIRRLRSSYSDVHILSAKPSATIFELRAIGLSGATGEVVALTEDHVVADANWLDALIESADFDVAGGAVDNAQRARAIDWGVYFAEYGVYAGTRPDDFGGGHSLLTAANVVYRRAVLPDVVSCARAGEWENVAHDRLQGKGYRLRFVPKAIVRENNRQGFAEFCADRFEHGYTYARARLAEERTRSRALLLLATPALPFLLTRRIGVAAGPTRWAAFCCALPYTFAFLTSWSAGEALGYWRGPAARSLPSSLSPTS